MRWRFGASDRAETTIVSLISIGATVVSILATSGMRGWFGAALALIMLRIALYDARHLIIPDILAAAAFALSLLDAAASEPEFILAAVEDALLRAGVVAGSLLAVKLGYRHWRGRDGIGMGDVKLGAVAGAWLDWLPLAVAVEIAVVAGLGGYILQQYVRSRPLRATAVLPFGLYLAPAIWLGWLLQSALLAQ